MEQIFMINQLMIRLVVYQILLILKKNYRLIAVDLSKQKALHVDSRAIQQIISTNKIKAAANNTRLIIYYILEQSKETMLEFSKGTTKVF